MIARDAGDLDRRFDEALATDALPMPPRVARP
jgi:hypothetical protein